MTISSGGEMAGQPDTGAHRKPYAGVSNALSGVVLGSSVQAGVIHGGVHLHHSGDSAAAVVPRELPSAPMRFAGRTAELAELDRIASTGRPPVAVLCGPGGVGKSALALEWLHRRSDRYPDGQLYVDLGPPDAEPMLMLPVLTRLLRALGVTGRRVPSETSGAVEMFRSITASLRLALLIDNAVSAAQVRTLLPTSAASVVLVTSRWRLGGLAVDGADLMILDTLPQETGTEFLERIVGTARIQSEPDASNQLVRLCGGLPLALAITGARLVTRPNWPIVRVARELENEQRRLTALSIGKDGDEKSVTSVFDLSYHALSEAGSRAYRWLSVHPGPDISAGLAAAILCLPVEDTADRLDVLVDANLLSETRAGRYRFHDLVRLHARWHADHDDTTEELAAVFTRIVEYFLMRAVTADSAASPREWRLGHRYQQISPGGQSFAGPADALDQLEAELPNLMAVLRAAGKADRHELIWQLCEAMFSLFLHRKHFPEWISTYETGIEAAHRCGDHAALSRMHHRLGIALHNLFRREEAVEHGYAAVAAARRAGHAQAESDALMLVGMAQRTLGHHEEAEVVLRKAVDLEHTAGRPRGEALARRHLGQALRGAGRYCDAITELEQARVLAATVPDTVLEAVIMVRLASALTGAGRGNDAIEIARMALPVLQGSGSVQYEADVLLVWGEAAEQIGDLATARDTFEQARDRYRRAGLPQAQRVQQNLDRVEARLANEHEST